MRAIACKYDPYVQMQYRLKALRDVGHITDKISIRIIGGTWSYYSKQYQTLFMKELFRAANHSNSVIPAQAGIQSDRIDPRVKPEDDTRANLVGLQEVNETANNRIVELSIETRPDYIDVNEIKRLRMLGVTKVELGVQSLYDKVLQMNNRGNSVDDVIKATKLLKDAGFKVSYQMMPNLFGSSIPKDEKIFLDLFNDSSYQPDHLKIYPLALIEKTELFNKYIAGQFKPYTADELTKLLSNIKSSIPYYCRVERIIRDIPAESIVEGGAKISNLRQIVANEMAKNNLQCHCVRCREVKQSDIDLKNIKLFRQDYDASDGKEIFLSFESPDRKYLVSLLRLRIPSYYFSGMRSPLSALDDIAIIRELHTYGPQVAVGQKTDSPQHHGFGQRLVAEAENIAKNEFEIKKIAVISGIGTREYFRKFGYNLDRTYMTKIL